MTDVSRQILSGLQVFAEGKWLPHHAVIVEDGKIKAVIPAEMVKHHLPARQHTYAADYFLIPGLIDLHVHGAKGVDVMDATLSSLTTLKHELAKEGVTGFLATTMTTENDHLESVLKLIPAAMAAAEGAAILGVHLEGPFIAENKKGAQQALSQAPDLALFRHWQTLAENAIKVVTLAPELPGSIPFIQALHRLGVIVSVGHTNATYEETMAAIEAGATQATHLFNAMRGIHHRDPGAALALLLSRDISAELILDSWHLHPAMAELAFTVKGDDRLFLVSDAMRAKCMGDGEYDLGGQHVSVKSGKATLSDGTLAGSTLRLPEAIQRMVKASHCTLDQAISMASTNPANALGLLHKGVIDVGFDADMVVLNNEFNPVMTMVGGEIVFKA